MADAPNIQVNVQYVKDLSFENPNAPHSLVQAQAPKIDIQVNVGARNLGENVFEVVLNVQGDAKHEEESAFIVDLSYAGVFTLDGVPEEHVHPMLFIECPRLLFPFARAIIAGAVRDGGFPPLMIQPIDFLELYRRQAEAQQAGGAA